MFESGKYDWCLFVGHLALEKLLKALFVDQHENDMPPKIHNLVRLAELSSIGLNEDQNTQQETMTCNRPVFIHQFC